MKGNTPSSPPPYQPSPSPGTLKFCFPIGRTIRHLPLNHHKMSALKVALVVKCPSLFLHQGSHFTESPVTLAHSMNVVLWFGEILPISPPSPAVHCHLPYSPFSPSPHLQMTVPPCPPLGTLPSTKAEVDYTFCIQYR